MTGKKVQQLTQITLAASGYLIPIADDPTGNGLLKSISFFNLTSGISGGGGVGGNSPTFTGQAKFNTLGYTLFDNGNSGSGKTIDWGTNGNIQKVTLNNNCTFTFTAPTNAGMLLLEVVQTSGNTFNSTWPTAKWAGGVIPSTSPAASGTLGVSSITDVMNFYYNGSTLYGACSIPNAK